MYNSRLLPSQSWSCPSWRRYWYWPRPTSCLRRLRWWKTPRWGGRRGRSSTCAASTWTRRSAPLPRRRTKKWFRGSNKWRAPRKPDTRVQNTTTCPEASLCTASPNCCSSSALCTQLNTISHLGMLVYLAMRMQTHAHLSYVSWFHLFFPIRLFVYSQLNICFVCYKYLIVGVLSVTSLSSPLIAIHRICLRYIN